MISGDNVTLAVGVQFSKVWDLINPISRSWNIQLIG